MQSVVTAKEGGTYYNHWATNG